MIRNATFADDVDLIPEAIVNRPLAIPAYGRFKLERGVDDLDAYEGRDLLLSSPDWPEPVPVALRRYDGHPPDTFTIYVERRVHDGGRVVDQILRFIQLREEWLVWRRSPALPATGSDRVAAVA